MPNKSFASVLLSLFTSQQHAEEIEGDLLEEGTVRGQAWFAYQLVRVTLALFGESCREAPLRLTLLATLATGFTILACVALDRVFLAPDALLPTPFAGMVAVVLAALLIGLALSYFGARLGIRAAACTAIFLTALLILKYSFASWGVSVVGYFLLSVAILPVPLVVGSVIGHSLRSKH